MDSLIGFEGGDIRRAGEAARPANLYVIKSQPRAAVLQEEMNRALARSAGKRLSHHINSLLEDHWLGWGGFSLPFGRRRVEPTNSCLIPAARSLVLHGGFDPSRSSRPVHPIGSPLLY
jgi:hypothetical protein